MRVKTSDPWVYCSVDYASIELCTGSDFQFEVFGKSTMGDAINDDQDLHCRMAARVMDKSYEYVRDNYKKDKALGDMRQAMKPVNYGLAGKMGAPKLVQTARKDGIRFCELAGVSKDCAKNERTTEYRYKSGWKAEIPPSCVECLTLAEKFIGLWFEEFPEWKDTHELTDKLAEQCKKGDPIESMGEGMLRLETNPNAVANHFFQNPAAQGAKHAGWLLSKEMYTDRKSVLYNNARIVVFVHDENMTEIREAVMHEAAYRKAEIMVAGMKEYVKHVKVKAEPALARRWFKGMEASFDKNKRLKPWWPVGKGCKPLENTHAEKCSCWKWPNDQSLMLEDLAA